LLIKIYLITVFLANVQCNYNFFFFNHANLFIINERLTTNEYKLSFPHK